nr:MAG TPA: hypothetical protein [Podoviridae sp. ct13o21]
MRPLQELPPLRRSNSVSKTSQQPRSERSPTVR